jgi:hypothetical protein
MPLLNNWLNHYSARNRPSRPILSLPGPYLYTAGRTIVSDQLAGSLFRPAVAFYLTVLNNWLNTVSTQNRPVGST